MGIFNNIIIFILGTSIGSFLNVLIDRLPQEKSILGRSRCDFCHKKLNWFDLIPILSFFFLGGRCRYCNKKLSWQYPVVEALTGLAFVFTDFAVWGIIACLIVIFFTDLKYHLISDYILLSLFIFSLLFHVIPTKVGIPVPINEILKLIQNDVISGLIVALPIFLIYFLSRERAMGQGDVYLSAIVGFLLGWKAGFIALYIAFVTGAIFGIIMIILHKKKLKSKIAFGPFIVVGTTIMLFWGEKVFDIIKQVYGF